MPKVSIIIPAFNSGRFIKKAVESVLAQTFTDIEVIIVDDGSADATASELGQFTSGGRVRLIREPNKGPSAARNKGISEARGELISFLDSDDIYLRDRIEEGVKALEGGRKAVIAYSDETFFLEKRPHDEIKSPHPKFSGDIFFYLKRSNFIHTSTVITRRSLFEKLRFDETLRNHEDWDLFLGASAGGALFRYIPKALARVSLREKGLTASSPEWAKSREIVGKRAKELWKEIKAKDPVRYIKLKTMAAFIGFPGSSRFNRKMPHGLLNQNENR